MSDKYILDGHETIPCDNLMKWAKWFEKADRHIAKTKISNVITISTIFLGLDHSFGEGEPILFETVVFGGKFDGEMERYSTWEQAKEGHKKIVKKVKKD